MKAIYKPNGKAGEYAQYACNLYVGCSNDCSYCYCKKYPLSKVWSTTPRLKKAFKDEQDAYEAFRKDVTENREKLRAGGGIFFSFTTDPCLSTTINLTAACVTFATMLDVPCTILTKRTDWLIGPSVGEQMIVASKGKLAVGMSITGLDTMEVNSDSNGERLEALLHVKETFGVPVFISAEPVVDFDNVLPLLRRAIEKGVDLVKVGLMSGKSDYNRYDATLFANRLILLAENFGKTKIYFKDSIRKYFNGIYMVQEPEHIVVGPDYNIFK